MSKTHQCWGACTPRTGPPMASQGMRVSPKRAVLAGVFLTPPPGHFFRGRFFRGCGVVTSAVTRMNPRFLRVCKVENIHGIGLNFHGFGFDGPRLLSLSLSFIEGEREKEGRRRSTELRKNPRNFQLRTIRKRGKTGCLNANPWIAHCEIFNVFNGLRFWTRRSPDPREICPPPHSRRAVRGVL